MSTYEQKMNEIQSTVNQLQQLVINKRKNRMKMENQLFVAQDKIGVVERRTKLLGQKNEYLQKSWIVGMRTLHQSFLQICNLLQVVVEFLRLV